MYHFELESNMSSGLTNDMPQPGEIWKHQNGIEYHIDKLARVDNEYQELVVVATGPDGISWARPIGNFLGLKNGKPRFVKVQSDYTHPGVSFSGPLGEHSGVVRFDKGCARVVTESLQTLKGRVGTWVLNADGSLSMGVRDKAAEPYAIIDGVTYVSEEELKKHHAFNISPADLGVRVDSLASQVLMLADKLKVTASSDGYEFNNPQDLPPVGCELLIKVPAGTDVTTLEGQKSGVTMGYTTEAEAVFKAFRTKHLANRSGEMEYRLPDDSTVTGRFPWTYP